MKLSCVITTRNRQEVILRTLDHLERETGLPDHDWEILVVDNGSTDGTSGAVSRRRRVRVISLAENEGVPARNLALAHARGKYVAFLGDDVRPVGRALSTALAYLARHTKTGAIVGRVTRPDGTADAPALPAVLMGDASIVRKSVLATVGGFAAEFFRQAADYELSFRIWRAGFRIERFEDVGFTRDASPTDKPSALTCRMDLRNNLILCERYLRRPLRHAYRRDWMRRYAILARHDAHARAVSIAIKEARIWAHRESAVGRQPLGVDAIESIFGLDAQRQAVERWARAHSVRRVCIADWGKNLLATWQAARGCGLKVEAILDNAPAFANSFYRRVPVLPDAAAERVAFDGIVLSTVNPAQVDDRAAALEFRFGKPVLRLWEPRSLNAPPPRNATDPASNLLRKIDRAA